MSSSYRDVLSGSPTYDELLRCLSEWTVVPAIVKLTTQDALIARALVIDVLPNFWPLARDDAELRSLIVKGLSSLAGVNSLLSQLHRNESLEVLQCVLESSFFLLTVAYEAWFAQTGKTGLLSQPSQLWQQYLGLIPGGKILTSAAEATSKSLSRPELWIDTRHKYAAYLAGQIAQATKVKATKELAQYADRALSLDARTIVQEILKRSIPDRPHLANVAAMAGLLSTAHKKQFLSNMLQHLQATYLDLPTERSSIDALRRDGDRIGAVASLIKVFQSGEQFAEILLHDASLYTLSMRRAIVLTIVNMKEAAKTCLETFADALYIKHTPVIAQEALTETLLLLCSYLSFEELTLLSKSGSYVNAISNRLESTTDRLRFLGMIVGEAISAQVISDEKKRLTFGVPDTSAAEAFWWKALIEVEDTYRELSDLTAGLVKIPEEPIESVIEESAFDINEIIEDEPIDEEFQAMRIPDSDDEDSEEDPTLIDREKVPPPVYIRDLIKMLNNHESYRHINIGLQTAATLIRRKATFGTELSDYAVNLTQILAGLTDNFDMTDFQALRQDALKALVVSCPLIVAPYLTRTFFTGDYSLQQRVVILSAIGLGARELSGIDAKVPDFASKRLPPIQEVLYSSKSLSSKSLPPTKPLPKSNTAEVIMFSLLGQFAVHSGRIIRDSTTFYESSLIDYYVRTCTLVYQTTPRNARITYEFVQLLKSIRNTDPVVVESVALGMLLVSENYVDGIAEWAVGMLESSTERVQLISAAILRNLEGKTKGLIHHV